MEGFQVIPGCQAHQRILRVYKISKALSVQLPTAPDLALLTHEIQKKFGPKASNLLNPDKGWASGGLKSPISRQGLGNFWALKYPKIQIYLWRSFRGPFLRCLIHHLQPNLRFCFSLLGPHHKAHWCQKFLPLVLVKLIPSTNHLHV